MPENIKNSFKDQEEEFRFDITDPKIIGIAIVIIMWFGLRWTQPSIEANNADNILTYMVALGAILYGSWQGIYMRTPKLIGNGISTTTKGEYNDRIGIWHIFTIGDIRAFGFEQSFKNNGAIIVPWWCWQKVGKGICLMTRVERKRPKDLPLNVRVELLQKGYKEPFYLGYVTEEVEEEVAEMQEVLIQLDQANRNSNMLADLLQNNFSTFEDAMKFLQRMSKMGYDSGPGLKERAKRFLKPDAEVHVS